MHTICIPQNDATVINDNLIYNQEIHFFIMCIMDNIRCNEYFKFFNKMPIFN